ncbi:lanthionine synthetase C family protein [Paenibacillus sp. MMS20-IR301]|uniref:lanthionine synthetase C family protein n=1 Tax=Paenibacillus sp. MMS20-IR301 TaxID=2895946 RepID=UPI0028F147B5|nr:lanthionine synthetase C family protein [Paenibacillus sp. MMS20-IR301]WNS41171.1 lanthionine synthetase C family protein [Paenibacillus sp. MMS20-IR301]
MDKELDKTIWRPITGPLRERALQVLLEIAERYKEPEKVRALMQQVPAEELDGISYERWRDLSLASGFPGICLLMGQLDQLYPDGGWDLVGHQYLGLVRQTIEAEGVYNLSLFNGLAGVLLAVQALSRGRTRYSGMINNLADLFEERIPYVLSEIRVHWKAGVVRMGDYDVIQGLSGIGRVALLFSERPLMRSALESIVELFHLYCGEKHINGYTVPAWHVSSENQFLAEESSRYPNGNFNLGLSHGVSGPLAFLSISYSKGIMNDAVTADIYKLAEFLCKCAIQDENGIVFPGRVSFEEWVKEDLPSVGIDNRDSWCYGAPGIARSLWLAGKALNNDKWLETGKRAYSTIANREPVSVKSNLGILCHGSSGLIHLLQRMYSETGDNSLLTLRDKHLEELLYLYEPESLFGYYDDSLREGTLTRVDEAGFLTGASGVALVLASLLGEQNPEWDLALMLQ